MKLPERGGLPAGAGRVGCAPQGEVLLDIWYDEHYDNSPDGGRIGRTYGPFFGIMCALTVRFTMLLDNERVRECFPGTVSHR